MMIFFRKWTIWLGFLLLPPTAFCQAPSQSVTPAVPSASPAVPVSLPIVDQIKKTVVFLQTDCRVVASDGSTGFSHYAGTSFLLSVTDPRMPDGFFEYLVTNRHVAQPGIENGKSCDVAGYLMRGDTKTAGPTGSYSTIEPIPVSALHWSFSTDASVDLAITPIGLNVDKLDVVFLPSSLLLGQDEVEKNHVVEGDSVLFTGLFVQIVGQNHSEPIVREGKIAMMPREQIPTTLNSLGDVYLVDSHVFGGNSGSPMFIDLAGMRGGSITTGVNYRVFGVVSGYVREDINLTLQPVAAYAGTVAANSGIAMVVPAQKVLDIINSQELQKQRDDVIKAQSVQHASPTSSASPR